MKLGLREANQHFSKAIKAVRAGKEVILTERGQPIAVIKPIKEGPRTGRRIEADGRRGTDHVALTKGPLPRFEPVKAKGKPISQTIIDDRDDRV